MKKPKYTIIYQNKSGCNSRCNFCNKKITLRNKRLMVDPAFSQSGPYSNRINCADLCSDMCAELYIIKTYETIQNKKS